MESIRNSSKRIEFIAKERILDELNKILLTDVPSKAIYLLDHVGILKRIIPTLVATKGVQTVAGEKHEETFSHSLMVLDNIAGSESNCSMETVNSQGIKQGKEPNLWLRWTALLHDIGKPVAKKYVQGKGWSFYGYDAIGAKMIPNVFSSMKMPMNDNMRYVQKLISLQNRPKELLGTNTTESAFRRLLLDAGEYIDDLLLLCEANITTKNKTKAKQEFADMESVRQKLYEVKASDSIRNFKNPINANYIMELYGLKQGRILGTFKDAIKDAILRGEIGNNFEEASNYLRKIASEMGLICLE
jgi:poly(A) polymerase